MIEEVGQPLRRPSGHEGRVPDVPTVWPRGCLRGHLESGQNILGSDVRDGELRLILNEGRIHLLKLSGRFPRI
eukprot:14199678-Alexandrium_andersonii.AAC.1